MNQRDESGYVSMSVGRNVSLSTSIFSFNFQTGVTIDDRGNVVLQYSYGTGVTSGTPSASFTKYESVSNVSTADQLDGIGYQAGGSMGVPVCGMLSVVGGIDVMIIPDIEKNYYGITRNIGIGSAGTELHVEWADTNDI